MTPLPSTLPRPWLDAAVELMGRAGRGGTVRVQGRSMVPTLEEGWLLAVEFAPGPLSRGDLVVFRRDDLLVVHRLLGERRRSGEEPSFRMRGDGLPWLDPPVPRSSVVARVLALHDGRCWRDVRRPAARAYAAMVALHDRWWALVSHVLRKLSGVCSRGGLSLPFERVSESCDRFMLRLVHRMAFRAVHREIPPPREAARTEAGT